MTIRRPASGFTLLEMLMVVFLIAIMSGLLLAGLNSIRSSSKVEQTRAIMSTARTGIQRYQVEFGGAEIIPVPHPGLLLAANRSNWCADGRLPLLYGMPTHSVGLFHVPSPGLVTQLTAEQRGSWTIRDVTGDGLITAEDGASPDDAEMLFESVLGVSNVLDELKVNEGVQTNDSVPNILYDSLYSPDGPELTVGDANWSKSPGRIKLGDLHADHHRWKRYSLPRIGLYDAWGNEILYMYDRQTGAVGFLSAGPDGVMAIDPGENGIFETVVYADATSRGEAYTLSGNDKDGTQDNIHVGFTGAQSW